MADKIIIHPYSTISWAKNQAAPSFKKAASVYSSTGSCTYEILCFIKISVLKTVFQVLHCGLNTASIQSMHGQ